MQNPREECEDQISVSDISAKYFSILQLRTFVNWKVGVF